MILISILSSHNLMTFLYFPANTLDVKFDSIENMMFTRVMVTDKSGSPKLDVAVNVITKNDGD